MKKKEEGSQIGNNFCASFVNSKNIENYGFVLCLYYFIIGKCSSSMAQRPFWIAIASAVVVDSPITH